MLFGEKLKQLRKLSKKTLVELSEESGVQVATLSRMENNKMTGTVESHMSIAKALQVDIVELYRDQAPTSPNIEIKGAQQHQTDIFFHNDKASYEILTNQVLQKKMMPTMLTLEPLGATAVEQNKPGSEKFVHILKGHINIQIEEQIFKLKKDQSLYFDGNLQHQFINKTKHKAQILIVTTPIAL